MKLRISKYMFLLMMAVFALASCSEDDNTVDEYANWQARNEKLFADTLAYARQQIAAGNTDEWKVIPCWSLVGQTPNKDFNGNNLTLKYNDTDYIVVHVLEKGTGTDAVLYTDSIQMSYRGRLIPTDSYQAGKVFDQTFTGSFDAKRALPTKATVNTGWVDGFTTALMAMRPGDHWQVFMPYSLAYGTSDQQGIPAYSTLRFELALHAYKRLSGKNWVTK